jgi:hypothetical protein
MKRFGSNKAWAAVAVASVVFASSALIAWHAHFPVPEIEARDSY